MYPKVESTMQRTISDSYLGIIEYSEDLDRYEGKIYTENNEPIEFNFIELASALFVESS